MQFTGPAYHHAAVVISNAALRMHHAALRSYMPPPLPWSNAAPGQATPLPMKILDQLNVVYVLCFKSSIGVLNRWIFGSRNYGFLDGPWHPRDGS